MNEKVDPYMAPVWEALSDILGAEQLRRRRDRGEIEVAPIAFMRGRTLNQAFVIVDEAQNTSRLQAGAGADPPGRRRSDGGDRRSEPGRPDQRRRLGPVPRRAHPRWCEGRRRRQFEASDVVRHPLVERIVKAYDADTKKKKKKGSGAGQKMIEVEIGEVRPGPGPWPTPRKSSNSPPTPPSSRP